MISDCSSIRMQSTSCCFTSVTDITFFLSPVDLGTDLVAPQFPGAHPGHLVDAIREPPLLGIQRGYGSIARLCRKCDGPVLDPGIDFRVDGSKYRCLERRSTRHTAVRTHEHDVLAAQDGSECDTPFLVADEHVCGAELLAYIEHRHARRNKGGIVEHRFERHMDQSERNDRWRMAVHNGLNVWPRLVDFAVNKTLDKTGAAIRVYRIAV